MKECRCPNWEKAELLPLTLLLCISRYDRNRGYRALFTHIHGHIWYLHQIAILWVGHCVFFFLLLHSNPGQSESENHSQRLLKAFCLRSYYTHIVIIWQRLFSWKPKLKFLIFISSIYRKWQFKLSQIQLHHSKYAFALKMFFWAPTALSLICESSAVACHMNKPYILSSTTTTAITPSWPRAFSHHCVSVKHKLVSTFGVAVGFSKKHEQLHFLAEKKWVRGDLCGFFMIFMLQYDFEKPHPCEKLTQNWNDLDQINDVGISGSICWRNNKSWIVAIFLPTMKLYTRKPKFLGTPLNGCSVDFSTYVFPSYDAVTKLYSI